AAFPEVTGPEGALQAGDYSDPDAADSRLDTPTRQCLKVLEELFQWVCTPPAPQYDKLMGLSIKERRCVMLPSRLADWAPARLPWEAMEACASGRLSIRLTTWAFYPPVFLHCV